MASEQSHPGMKMALLTLVASLLAGCTLQGCTLQFGIQSPTGTPTPYDESDLMTRGAATFDASDTSTHTPTEETFTPQAADTETPLPAETATEVPATATPTSPPAPEAAIERFEVSPTDGVTTGDELDVNWATAAPDGAVALCILQAIPGIGQERCLENLPESGERSVPITESFDGPLILTLKVGSGNQPLTASRKVTWACEQRWAFSTGLDLCPAQAPLLTTAAAQPFERGWMLYLEDPGLYVILTGQPDASDLGGEPYYWQADPLEVTQDTSQEVSPPEGLYAPESGFGLVWRGDASRGFQDELGWALEPEYNYTATFQCDNASSQWRFCYVTDARGRSIELHPLGNWKPLD